MKALTNRSFTDQRRLLRQQLFTQRQRIVQHITQAPKVNSEYPRSKIMRFLLLRPDLVSGVILGISTLLAGSRFLKSTTTMLTLIKAAQAFMPAKNRKKTVLA